MAFAEKGGGAEGYGDVALYLKKSAKGFMTFTPYDSGAFSANSKYDAEKIRSATAVQGNIYPLIGYAKKGQLDFYKGNLEKLHYLDYIEWQAHGAILFNTDVQYLTFDQKKE
ncbi:hypothetical protein ABK905_13950 [Acerihabitans sp. KWT182]|uniref:Uncharacterized protein n=1 Tax=Acerihabitans sp. KWT182 TaxID=3157919 RepID=A0AAU7Q6G6_9GAMM